MLELIEVSKSFPGVRALREVSLALAPGEIHGLVGENGAGKSTAIKIMAGLLAPDAGELRLEGRPVRLRDRRDGLSQGIALVPQDLPVIPDASAAENILLEQLAPRGWLGLDWDAIEASAAEFLARVGLAVDPRTPARRLSAAQRQLLLIAKALAARARVLILDEPTSSLTGHESARLFGLLRQLRAGGAAILFVSHKLEEVAELCDRITVLRDGQVVGARPATAVTPAELARLMVGRECGYERLGGLAPDLAEEVLRAEDIVRRGKIEAASFRLGRGEILGFYGLVGSGRTDLARILVGEEPLDGGRIFRRGRIALSRGAGESLRRHGLGYVTESRQEDGLFLDDSVQANIGVAAWERLRHPLTRAIDARKEEALARRFVEALDIRPADPERRVRHLSGGNQQKVSLAKWLAAECEILIVDEPTVGVDVGAKDQIHRLLWNLVHRQGKSLILISSDLPEMARLATRILVFRRGRIAGEVGGLDAGKSGAQIAQEIAPLLA